MKTGRNDPCPCGSGRKYKRCCLNKQAAIQSPEERAWRRLRRELEELPMSMLRFIDEEYGAQALAEAWEDFGLWDDEDPGFDPVSPQIPVFMPWFLHCWRPDPNETGVADATLRGVTPTTAFLERNGRHLSPRLTAYLRALDGRPFSFYEIESVDAGHGMTLCDLFTGDRHAVREASASRSLHPHDLVFSQLAEVDGLVLLEGLSPVALPASDKVAVIELRRRMAGEGADDDAQQSWVTPAKLRDWELEIRDLYLDLAELALEPPMRALTTPEGDPLEFHTLTWEIDSPQRAFDAFAELAIMPGDPDSEQGVERDAAGVVQTAHFELARPGQDPDAESTSLLGSVRIEPRRLIVEVNSRERAEWIKASLIPKAVGTATPHCVEQVKSIHELLADDTPAARRAPEPPLDDPETADVLAKYLRSHYQAWIDQPLPVLDGRTPRVVAATADGREQVAALLRSAEQTDCGVSAEARREIFDSLRAELQIG